MSSNLFTTFMTAVGLSRFLDLYFYTVCSLTTGKLHNLFSVDSISLLEKQGLWPPEIPGFLKCKPIHQENPMFTFHTFLCFFFTCQIHEKSRLCFKSRKS